jgi:ankyrin repeat protein
MQIHYLAARGDIAAVKAGLRRGVPVDAPLGGYENDTTTPLMFAARSPHAGTAMLQWLIDHGANVNAISSSEGNTPLGLAANSGSIDKMQCLLAAGADLNRQTPYRYTALIHAAYAPEQRRLPVIETLLRAGADPDVVTTFNESALSVTSYFADFACIKALLAAGADPAPLAWTPLMHAAAFGTVDEVAHQLAQSPDLTATDRSGRTAWQLSIASGDVARAQALHQPGAELHYADMLWAVKRNHAAMLRWLLALGADPNAADENGHTALMAAAEYGAADCVRLLLDAGADIEASDFVDSKAIDFATAGAVARLLVDAGADIDYINGQGYSALKYAAEEGDLQHVRDLLALGADPNTSSFGETALFVATGFDHLAVIETLLDAGADPNIITIDEWCPLEFVQTVHAAQLLLDHGADAAFRDDMDRTPADHHTDPDIIALLRQHERSAPD